MGIFLKIKERPDSEKKIFSLITASVLTLIIVVVYFSYGEKKSDDLIDVKNENKLSSISPLKMIKEEFSKAFATAKESLNMNNQISTSSVEVVDEIITSTSTESN